MFIFVAYKDAPELSYFLQMQRNSSITSASPQDLAVEKTLLVNPNCPVRIMLEYIRNKCKLGIFTQFDLADMNGATKGLFNMPTYAYATDGFEHKRTYYLVVIRTEVDKRISVLPQLNRENPFYSDLKSRVTRYLLGGELSPQSNTPTSKITPTPSMQAKGKKKNSNAKIHV